MLLAFLKSIYPALDDNLANQYISLWKEKTIAKKSILTSEDQVQRELLFVTKGFQKSYYLNEGKEYVIAFTYAPSFTGIPESFFTQQPSKYYLQTITDSTFLAISFHDHIQFLNQHRQIESLFRILTEQLLFGMVQRHYELMANDIETRFKNFLGRSPHLLNQIPHKDLASYLRIDASNFSKLLGKVKILV